jgi:hypothetical protein
MSTNTVTKPDNEDAKIAELLANGAFADISRLKQHVATHKARAIEYENLHKSEVQMAADKQKELEKQEEAQRGGIEKARLSALDIVAQMRKHRVYASFFVEGNYIVGRTHILFADIRLREGARKTSRVCIGAYDVKIRPSDGSMQVRNLIFTDHWAVSGGRPCLGEYSNDYKRMYERKDWYGIFDLFTHFLVSTEDAGAYHRAHDWRDYYRAYSSETGTYVEPGGGVNVSDFAMGDRVIFTNPEGYESAKTIYGMTGTVIPSASTDLVHVYFQDEMGGHESCAMRLREVEKMKGFEFEPGHCWKVPPQYLYKITEDQFAEASKYEIEGGTTMLQILDKFPKGKTYEEYLERRKLFEKEGGSITLTPVKRIKKKKA